MRRSLAVLASIGLGIGTIALATPAQATTEEVVITQDGDVVVDPSSVNATFISFDNKFIPTIDVTVTSELLSDSGTPCTGSGCTVPAGKGGKIFTVDPCADDATVTVSAAGTGEAELLVTYNGSSVKSCGGSDSGGGSAPAAVIQQFGLPASGNCEDGVTEAMNWSGVGSDGWGISWAQWANDGAGGAVCTRTVVYDTSTAKWVVN
jgi:hypothetical protein